MNIPRCAVAAALCAAASIAGAQALVAPEAAGRPIDWRPQWAPAPSTTPGWTERDQMLWGVPRRTGPGPRHPHDTSPLLRDINPPSPLADRYVPAYSPVPLYEVLIIPVADPCPPPYSASGCVPMR